MLGGAAADDAVHGRAGGRGQQLAALERGGVHLGDHGAAGRPVTGDDQGRLGHAVAGEHRLGTQPGGGEPPGERLDGGCLDGLGAVHRAPPAREVQPCQLLVGDPLEAEVVGEVRRGREVDVVPVDQRQPCVRTLEEGRRWHQHAVTAQDEGGEQQPDQAEVVVERQPAAHRAVGVHAGDRREDPGVGQQVGVVDHDALGVVGGPRGVLEEGQRVRVGRRRPPPVRRRRFVRDGMGREHGHAPEVLLLGPGHERCPIRAVGQGTGRSRVPGDRGEPVGLPPLTAVGRRRGHRDHARVHAAQEGPCEPRPGGMQDEQPVTGGEPILQQRGDLTGGPVEFPVRHRLVGLGAERIRAEDQGGPVTVLRRPRTHEVDEASVLVLHRPTLNGTLAPPDE
ncbi:hypothetical protein M2158_009822 [Streptomyces sp. SAI-144]|uniref:hypothetical protein n=1 Tax=Streptomyces sp. SAI-144 TaxID=2940544 RepID=UPI002476DB69|nr:hypothetical protein [Streptomyces sp. SAI-144]MDH6441281.1 hypothetical protein [Streptomyces sp. SAI-144]